MAEKREGQGARATDAMQAGPQLVLDLAEVIRAEVGQFGALDVPPDEFGRIELRRVAGQALDREPRALRPQVRLHNPALMRRQPIPDQDDATPAERALQVGQERDEGDVVIAAGVGFEAQPTPLEIPPECHGDGDGEFLPVEGVDQDGGLAPGRPRAADRRPLGDAALVFEDDPGAAAPSVFFTAGQRVVFQRSIAASSRSRARVAGRWRVQSSAPRRRQTCPG
jgi:hypothetical protein